MDQFSLDNIANGDGYSIALSGLAIVFFALIVVTVFISILPRVLARFATVWPEAAAVPEAKTSTAAAENDDGLIAAIGYIVHARQQDGSGGK
jgi:oxaloacetate decarboxylase gamma subunit